MSPQRPASVAKIGRRTPKHPQPLRAKRALGYLRHLARAMLLVIAVMLASALVMGLVR